MKIKFLIFILLIFSSSAFTQSVAEAERLFNLKQYARAKTMYEALLKSKPGDALYSYRLARCSYELKDWENAIRNFEISGSKFPLTQWYLAESLFYFYRFEEAITAFDNFILTLEPEDKRLQDIELQKKRAETAARLLRRIEDIAITDSVITDKANFLKKYDIGPELGILRQSTIKQNTRIIIDKITYTTQRGDRQILTDTIDGHTDIFSTYRLFDNWSEAVSISDVVNTSANENYPFLLPDGLTLYFASDGENSMGGFDIFVTKYSSVSQGFLAPENVGFPFNSPANDYMMAIDELHGVGWFATDRNQPVGKVVVYKFRLNEDKIIYRTQNADTLRLVASLRLTRKAMDLQNASIITDESADDDIAGSFNLIINDELVYTHFDDFKNPNALTLWYEYVKLKNTYNQTLKTLQDMRLKYESGHANTELTNSIFKKESEISELLLKMESKIKAVRNEEILFIGKKNQN